MKAYPLSSWYCRPFHFYPFLNLLFPNVWDHTPGSLHVLTVIVAELVEHELLFFRRAVEIKRDERYKETPPRKPVSQQKALCYRPEQVGGVHRVADVAIHAVRYERVLGTDLQRRRPVVAEIHVRTP